MNANLETNTGPTSATTHRPSVWKRWLRRMLLVVAALVTVILLVVWQSDHPVALFLKSQFKHRIADAPAVSLNFRRDPVDRPAIEGGMTDAPMLVMDPCVIADAQGLHLFYSTVFVTTEDRLTQFWHPSHGEQFDISKLPTGISYAFSADDGLTWSIREAPLLLPSTDGWDDYRVETANAVVYKDQLHIFYCGDSRQTKGRYQIGEVSVPLQNGSIQETLLTGEMPLGQQRPTPILAANFDRSCFHNNLQEPSVVVHDQGFEVFFVGLQMSEPALSLAADGQQLQRIGMGRAMLTESMQLASISQTPVMEFANIIDVQRTQQGLIAFVTLPGEGDAHNGEAIAYQTSADGLHWSQRRTLLTPREGEFDNWACMSPTAVFHNNRWTLFYTALQHDMNRPEDRWGMSMGPDGWLFGSLGRAVLQTP